MRIINVVSPILGLLLIAGAAGVHADEQEIEANGHPTVALADVLEVVARNSGREILVDSRTPSRVVVGQVRLKSIDYSILLSILRNNGMAAVVVGKVTNIVPVDEVRQHPLPVLHEDDDTIDAEEWVTRVVTVENVDAKMMVPILRPLLPRQGHLAANPATRTLLIADRYANVRRVVEIIRKIDAQASRQGQ